MLTGENNSRVRLSDLQLDVMRVLWRADSSVAEVADALQTSRGLAHTTVATVLSRLERAGVVASTRNGRHLRYRACISEVSVRHAMVSELLDSVFQGDADALLALVAGERRAATNGVQPKADDEMPGDDETSVARRKNN
ncbi:MAG: BlaI/MecI/CopY family transcriptional regulator [Dokdonella sp.]